MAAHRHQSSLRGVRATPKSKPEGYPSYGPMNRRYVGMPGHIHEVVEIEGKRLAKVGFDDRKIVYYLLDDLELDESAQRGTFHDREG